MNMYLNSVFVALPIKQGGHKIISKLLSAVKYSKT